MLVTYKRVNYTHIMKSVGVVFEVSDKEVVLAHNFTGLTPIDTTKIALDKIIESKGIIPTNINSPDDLKSLKLV